MIDKDAVLMKAFELKELKRCKQLEAALSLTSVNWLPDGICKYRNKDSVVSLHLENSDLPDFLRKRILAASESGYQILIVTPDYTLSSLVNLELLFEVNAYVCLIKYDGTIQPPLRIASAIAQSRTHIRKDDFKKIGLNLYNKCLTEVSSHAKGLRFEQLLNLLFSRVRDFHVIKSNYRTQTEEIDLVIQLHAVNSNRCWARYDSPFIFVEAKNQADPVGQGVISKLLGQIGGKGMAVKFGFVVAMHGFTDDAGRQAFRGNEANIKVVLITGETIHDWINSSDSISNLLEKSVIDALLD